MTSSHNLPAALVEAEFRNLAIDTSQAFTPGEERGSDGRGKGEVLLNRELLVEGVVLGDVGDVLKQDIEVFIQ